MHTQSKHECFLVVVLLCVVCALLLALIDVVLCVHGAFMNSANLSLAAQVFRALVARRPPTLWSNTAPTSSITYSCASELR
jgi:hypothetical protein